MIVGFFVGFFVVFWGRGFLGGTSLFVLLFGGYYVLRCRLCYLWGGGVVKSIKQFLLWLYLMKNNLFSVLPKSSFKPQYKYNSSSTISLFVSTHA